uniref:ribosomal protein S3 n=1 Tax=Tenuicylindrus belgicus TaxID=1398096 RepID=UPI002238195E|nr:ribosomal protein S3 [Tenuicylindrus belgicus]UYC31529.1 ribosomal protein S3 [Tenuicylindrus belgicus]
MGQKTHPLGFRLGITKEHNSTWYSNLKNYSLLLKEDDQIRTYLNGFAKLTSISNIIIERNSLTDQIQLIIETGRPGALVGENGENIKKILKELKKLLPLNRQITIKILEVKDVALNASLLGDLVVKKLEERVAFRRAVRDAMQNAQEKNVKGIKIQVSGRLNGAEIARSEWFREGRVPLQTLRADIDYVIKEANTIYGVLGIKVWVFKNEILKK